MLHKRTLLQLFPPTPFFAMVVVQIDGVCGIWKVCNVFFEKLIKGEDQEIRVPLYMGIQKPLNFP